MLLLSSSIVHPEAVGEELDKNPNTLVLWNRDESVVATRSERQLQTQKRATNAHPASHDATSATQVRKTHALPETFKELKTRSSLHESLETKTHTRSPSKLARAPPSSTSLFPLCVSIPSLPLFHLANESMVFSQESAQAIQDMVNVELIELRTSKIQCPSCKHAVIKGTIICTCG